MSSLIPLVQVLTLLSFKSINLDLSKLQVNPGPPLILTPYIKSNLIEEAQRLCEVPPDKFLNIKSYAGYLTVNPVYNSNLFFWYFPPKSGDENAEVILWLQGGPGGSSLFGLFSENGPLQVKQTKVSLREYSWNNNYHLVYIDNPVGTGFSFTENGYLKNQSAIGQDLYTSLVQFFELFPKLKNNSFFIFGESYAGKYIPAVGYAILKNGGIPNLKGLGIGNGWSDPVNQMGYGNYFYHLGLIDWNQLTIIQGVENEIRELVLAEKWKEANEVMFSLIDDNSSYFNNFSNFNLFYHFMHTNDYVDNTWNFFIDTRGKRKAIHVGSQRFNYDTSMVEDNLMEDGMKSVAPWIEELLSHYEVLLYNGQFDLICAYPLMVNYVRKLNFTGAAEYSIAPRKFWHVDGELAGYVKRAGNLTEVMVRNAGHMVPHDQPKWALDLVDKFIKNKFEK